MGAVAMFWFCATAFAMAIACCGRDPRAKLISAYLMGSCLLSNVIFLTRGPGEAIDAFTVIDFLALCTIYLVALRWPSRWVWTVCGALGAQIMFQVAHDLELWSDHSAFLINNLLYGAQLVAVVTPTISRMRPRRRCRELGTRAEIPPPYEGWKPPADYR